MPNSTGSFVTKRRFFPNIEADHIQGHQAIVFSFLFSHPRQMKYSISLPEKPHKFANLGVPMGIGCHSSIWNPNLEEEMGCKEVRESNVR